MVSSYLSRFLIRSVFVPFIIAFVLKTLLSLFELQTINNSGTMKEKNQEILIALFKIIGNVPIIYEVCQCSIR